LLNSKNNKKTEIRVYNKTENSNSLLLKNNQNKNSISTALAPVETATEKELNGVFNPLIVKTNFADKALKNHTLAQQDKTYEIAYGPCSAEVNCFLPYGVCLNETACLCLPDYANVFIKEESLQQIRCSYKKKKLIIAGLLELFLPLSLGHFYVLKVELGLIKLIYNLLVYSLCCVLFVNSVEAKERSIFVCLLLSCLIPIWNVTDMFLFFTGYYRDGYGVTLN